MAVSISPSTQELLNYLGIWCFQHNSTWSHILSPGSHALTFLGMGPQLYLQNSCLAFSSRHKYDSSGRIQYRKCEGHTLWRWLWGVTNGSNNLLPFLGEGGPGGDRRTMSLQLLKHSHISGIIHPSFHPTLLILWYLI